MNNFWLISINIRILRDIRGVTLSGVVWKRSDITLTQLNSKRSRFVVLQLVGISWWIWNTQYSLQFLHDRLISFVRDVPSLRHGLITSPCFYHIHIFPHFIHYLFTMSFCYAVCSPMFTMKPLRPSQNISIYTENNLSTLELCTCFYETWMQCIALGFI